MDKIEIGDKVKDYFTDKVGEVVNFSYSPDGNISKVLVKFKWFIFSYTEWYYIDMIETLHYKQ